MRNYSSKALTAAGIACLVLFLGCQRVDKTAPTVDIITPSDGDTLAQDSIGIEVNATDNWTMSRVEFYVDDHLKDTDSTGDADTYRYTWDASNESLAHTVMAKAYDTTGNSAEHTITVHVRPDRTAPTTAIIMPNDGDTLAQVSVKIEVRATDNKAISRVEFYVDDHLKGTDNVGDSDTFRYTWDPADESLAHTIKATAYDVAENHSEQMVSVYVRTDTCPATVRATMPTTDGHPQNLVCPRGTGRAYVTGEWDNAVYVIRTSDNVLVDMLRMQCGPTHIACSPDGQHVYVGSFDEYHTNAPDRLYSLRTSDNTVVDSLDLLGNPSGVACLPNGEYIYVSLDDPTNNVAVIRTSDFSVVTNIPVGREPCGIVALPNGQFVYVTCTNSDSVYVIRTSDNTVFATIDAGTAVHRLTVLPSGDYIYVSRYQSGAPVMVIRTSDNKVVDSIPVSYGRACGLTALPNGRYVYVTNRDANCVDIIRTSDNKVAKTVGVGSTPYGAANLPDGSGVYTANRGNSVTFIGY
ncbi:MAG: Ig-like domain-containing protein [candidate division WOR-3 bacterium]|nr:Ig-like domain-containing protein [candidate division WOR-3 bacterium]